MQNKFLDLTANPLMNLDHIYRYSGVKLVEPESLSSHITDVIMMGIKIIDEINYMGDSRIKLDKKVYLEKAIYHDLEESITGDVPRPLKYYNDNTLNSMREVADGIALNFFNHHFRNSSEAYEIWKNAKDKTEGIILKIVDTLCVAHKVNKEVELLGNLYMLRVAHEVTQYLKEILQDLMDKPLYPDEKAINDYIYDILNGAITSMQELEIKYSDVMRKFNIVSNSMI